MTAAATGSNAKPDNAVGDGKAIAVEADDIGRPQRRQRRRRLIKETAIDSLALHVKLARLARPLDFANFVFDRVSDHADQGRGKLARVAFQECISRVPAYAARSSP